MPSSVLLLEKKKLIHPPKFLISNLGYEVLMGSRAYGCYTDNSDYDIYGWCFPTREQCFPHEFGYIYGFDSPPEFQQFQTKDEIIDKDDGKRYNVTVFGLQRYVELLFGGNPNIIDSLFVPDKCVKHTTIAGEIIRNNRKLFLSKELWVKMCAYAASQVYKIKSKKTAGNRKELIDLYGMDTKYFCHAYRLVLQCEQILKDGDLDVSANSAILSNIRKGLWTLDEALAEFNAKKLTCEALLSKTSLPDKPNKEAVKSVLSQCLKIHYSESSIIDVNADTLKIMKIKEILC